MLRRHVGVLLWLPGNPETTGNGDGWDDGLRGRWSPSKLPSVIKTIHSHLCVNRKQKRGGFFFVYLTSWHLTCVGDVGSRWERVKLRCLPPCWCQRKWPVLRWVLAEDFLKGC